MTRWEDKEIAAETKPMVESVASAIANCRVRRDGFPVVCNVLEMLKVVRDGSLYDDLMEEARVAIDAVRAFDNAQITRFHGEPT
jgi:hypothetical protein